MATARIIGTGMTAVGKLGMSATSLMSEALQLALKDTRSLSLADVDGLIVIPSLAEPRFMHAHFLATHIGLLPKKKVIARTIDTGGAGPITGLLQAAQLIKDGACRVVAVVAGDAVYSLQRDEFLHRADQTCMKPGRTTPSPVIPYGYDRVAQWQMAKYGVTREQLAMCAVLMSMQSAHHPLALVREPYSLARVLASPPVAPVTSVLECARRADGGAAVLVASADIAESLGEPSVQVLGGGEGSGPLYWADEISEDMFSAAEATSAAYGVAGLAPSDIDFFALYDCFPICLIRAVEAVGLAPAGHGGAWIEAKFEQLNKGKQQEQVQDVLPVNTHGGLLGFGAPWEVPAIYGLIEAIAQLRGTAGVRQINGARRALVYGNGGIFSSSAVAILEKHS